jgi:hypothetical protein
MIRLPGIALPQGPRGTRRFASARPKLPQPVLPPGSIWSHDQDLEPHSFAPVLPLPLGAMLASCSDSPSVATSPIKDPLMIEIYAVVIVCPFGSTLVTDLAARCAAEAEAVVSALYPRDYAVFAHFECYRKGVQELAPALELELEPELVMV